MHSILKQGWLVLQHNSSSALVIKWTINGFKKQHFYGENYAQKPCFVISTGNTKLMTNREHNSVEFCSQIYVHHYKQQDW